MSNTAVIAQTTSDNDKAMGRAWLALCFALVAHVTDEALTDFLSIYNPAVATLRSQFPFLPLPTFTFDTWLSGLILGCFFLLSLSPFAFAKARWMVPVAYIFGLIMLLNGLGHIAGSFYLQRFIPGVYSSPLLLTCSIYLLCALRRQGAKQS